LEAFKNQKSTLNYLPKSFSVLG